ncbi:hypothetical protein RM96_05680 [Cupriavidus sp. IDO]|nr:hypothetical protein RM96_05680 [Cupriavidus sp. IDO]
MDAPLGAIPAIMPVIGLCFRWRTAACLWEAAAAKFCMAHMRVGSPPVALFCGHKKTASMLAAFLAYCANQ